MTVLVGEKKVRISKKKMLTYEDYAKLTPPDSGNYELHNGEIIYTPTPIPKHQLISSELHIILGSYIKKHQLGKLIAAPMDVKFSKTDTVQPDLFFISNEKLTIIGEKKIEGAPDFIIEIFSPSNKGKEMSYKKYLYESFGVKEYWIIYPLKNMIRQFKNSEEEFVLIGEYGLDDTVSSITIEGFSLKVGDVLN